MTSLAELDAFLDSAGGWGYLVFALAGTLEYLFPPFPGDTIVLMGGAWAARVHASYAVLYAVLTLGSSAGIALNWRVGRLFATRLALQPESGRVWFVPVARVRQVQAAMCERSVLVLVSNRFLPSFRAIVFVAAGASGLSLGQCLLWGTLSSMLHTAILLAVGASIGNNAQAISSFFSDFQGLSLAVLAVVLIFFSLRFFWRRARAKSLP
jgi:membrane protein DedA with SNARE-associated domain